MFNYLRKIKDYFLIKRSGLFDEDYYCLKYPDVRKANVNPLWHFVSSGWHEKRNPSEDFVTDYYISMNSDVHECRINPLVHYALFGKDEGRPTNGNSQLKEVPVIEVLGIENILTPTQIKKNPKTTHSLVDIVIYVNNERNYVQTCLESITQNTSIPYRLIIISDCSNESTIHFLRSYVSSNSNVVLHENQENFGYSKSANIGMGLSTADFVLVLTSDTVVYSGWLDRLMSPMHDIKVGITGPLSNTVYWHSFPKGMDGDDWGIYPIDESLSLEEYADWIQKFASPIRPEVSLLNGFCLLIRKALILEIGSFDVDTFSYGYGEIDDFCIRAKNCGWKLILCDDVYVHNAQVKSISDAKREDLFVNSSEKLNDRQCEDLVQKSVNSFKTNRVLQGIKIHIQYISIRTNLIKDGKAKYSGKKILFLLPVTAPGGGANVIFSEALAMEHMGVEVSILNMKGVEANFNSAYPNFRLPVYFDDTSNLRYYVNEFDAVIATINTTVESLVDLTHLGKLTLGYYIQGFEPLIYPVDSPDYKKALDSYTLIPKIKGFCKTAWTQNEIYKACNVKFPQIGISVDVDKFQPSTKKLDASIIRIAAMVRPSTLYRMPAETMKLLARAKQYYTEKVEVLIFGCTDEEITKAQLSKDFKYKNAGIINPVQVSALLNETDIFIDYSSHQAMGLTILEAMTLGVATLVPLNGGTVEYAVDRENSLIFDSSSFNDAWTKLSELIENNDLRKKLGANAIVTGNAFFPEISAINILKILFDEKGS